MKVKILSLALSLALCLLANTAIGSTQSSERVAILRANTTPLRISFENLILPYDSECARKIKLTFGENIPQDWQNAAIAAASSWSNSGANLRIDWTSGIKSSDRIFRLLDPNEKEIFSRELFFARCEIRIVKSSSSTWLSSYREGLGALVFAFSDTTSPKAAIVHLLVVNDEDFQYATDMESLFLHELGHALGLSHINGAAVMRAGSDPSSDWLGQFGVTEGLEAILGMKSRLLSKEDIQPLIKLYGELNPNAVGTVFVSVNELNVRSGPGTNYDRIGRVQKGNRLQIFGKNQDCTWIQVTTSTGINGWVSITGLDKRGFDCNNLEVFLPVPVVTPSPTVAPAPLTPISPPSQQSTSVKITGLGYPTQVTPGQQFRPQVAVSISSGQLLVNRGDMLRNTDGNLYGAHPHVAVEKTVNVGETYTFIFYENNPITAPSAEGTYESHWRVWANGAYVGDEAVIRFTVRNSVPATPIAPAISFGADRTSINNGECVTLRWDVDNVREVYLDGQGVTGHGSQKVCPTVTQTYKLTIVRQDSGREERTFTIEAAISGDTSEEIICGQFIWICDHKWPAFLPAGSNEPWIIDQSLVFDVFTEGSYASLDSFEFSNDQGAQCGYPNVKYMLHVSSDFTTKSSCGTTQPAPTPANQPSTPADSSQLRDVLLAHTSQSGVPNTYSQQATQLIDILLAHLDEFQLSHLGITRQTMTDALNQEDVGDRINGIVQAVWGNWADNAKQGGFDANTTDPDVVTDMSPFRKLLIRMIQGRQGRLEDTEQHALHNFFTRAEESHVWRDNINGVIGAVNRESFQWQ